MSELTALPAELRASSRWVLWRLEDFEERKRCKVPKTITGKNASSTDPDSWTLLETALLHLPKLKPFEAYRDDPCPTGVGLIIGAPYLGLDIDKCIEEGDIAPWAKDIISQLPATYTEFSPSGKGFHLWFRCAEHGKLPDGIRTEKVEVYSRKRYFTMTGDQAPGSPDTVTEISKDQAMAIFTLVDSHRKPAGKKSAPATSGSAKLQELMTKTDFPDKSAAVQSLLVILALDSFLDRDFIETQFKLSKLYQETHWKEKWERLGTAELDKAISNAREHLRNRKTGRKHQEDEINRSFIVERGSTMKREHLYYQWEPYLPVGQLVHFGGAQAQGKSPITVDLAARISTAQPWPDGQPNTLGAKAVLMMSIEDDPASVTLPRFDLAGGNAELIYFIKGTKVEKESTSYQRGVALDTDLHLLAQTAREIPNLGLVIIDPITNYLGKVKMNAEEEVRSILMPLALLAAELKITIINVGHFNRRDKGTDPLNRLMGAAAFTGVARSVTIFGPDPDIENTHHHIMIAGRGDTESGGLKYHTEVTELTYEGDTSKVVKIIWDGKAEVHAEDATDNASRQDKGRMTEAAQFIREMLSSGQRGAQDCYSLLRQQGFDPAKTSFSRALARSGGKSKRDGKGWAWYLPTQEGEETNESNKPRDTGDLF